jgi:hypothetical protein
VVVLAGETDRWPRLCTAPTPLSMDMSVAPLMDQLKVDDWPRSMVVGSAEKLAITGLATLGGGGVVLVATGGGGGGGGGTFFLQPDANRNRISSSNIAPILEVCNL